MLTPFLLIGFPPNYSPPPPPLDLPLVTSTYPPPVPPPPHRSGILPNLQGPSALFTGSKTPPATFGPNPNVTVTMGGYEPRESHSAVGTIHFMAPEVIFERRYGRSVRLSDSRARTCCRIYYRYTVELPLTPSNSPIDMF